MPIYIVDIEFGFEIKEIKAKNRNVAIAKANIPVGAVFTIRKGRNNDINSRKCF